MTVFLALTIPALLWATSNLIDKVLTPIPSKDRALSLVFVSSGIGIITTPLLLLFGAAPWKLSSPDLLRSLASGVVFVLACYPYFRAMQRSNPTTVAVLLQTIPVFNYILAYLFLGELLTTIQLFGIGIIMVACGLMCGLHRILYEKVDLFTFSSGLLCAILYSIPAVLFKSGAPEEHFLDASCATQLGTALPFFLLLAFPYARTIAYKTTSQLHGSFLALNLTNEFLAQIANFWFRSVFYIVPVSIAVPIAQGLQTLFVFLLSLGVVVSLPRLRNNFSGTTPTLHSLCAIILCAIGMYLLYR